MVDRCGMAGLEQSNQPFSLKTFWHVTAGKAQVNIKNEWWLYSFELFQFQVHCSLHMLTLLCLTTVLEWAAAVLFLERGVRMSAVKKTWRSQWYFRSNTFSELYINMHNSNFLSQIKKKKKKDKKKLLHKQHYNWSGVCRKHSTEPLVFMSQTALSFGSFGRKPTPYDTIGHFTANAWLVIAWKAPVLLTTVKFPSS